MMNRGDRREDIFLDDEDRERFLETLEGACANSDWWIHAYCLMGNHFHLVLETPSPTLVVGMKWMLETYTQRFNARHRLRGHLFAGRYSRAWRDRLHTVQPEGCSRERASTPLSWTNATRSICGRSATTSISIPSGPGCSQETRRSRRFRRAAIRPILRLRGAGLRG